MTAKKLIGIIGSGQIGTNPFDARSWSGSSRFFFETCDRFGILQRAFGVEVPSYLKIPLVLRNFSLNFQSWRIKFHLDINYYEALTREILKWLQPEDFLSNILQIGAIYNIPKIVNGRTNCYSYHDGNLAQLTKSPYWKDNISRSVINRALAYEQDVYQSMEKIFTMSNYLRQSFIDDFHIPSERVKTIGGGINLECIPDIADKDYEKKHILFIGIDFNRKGGWDLLRAFRIVRESFKNAKLHIVGPRKLQIGREFMPGVEFHGFLSRSNPVQKELVDSILHDSSVFAMPSRYEPFGIAPLEAMVHRIPCVLTNGWAFPEMVQPGINGELVEIGNVDELADKLKYLLSNPDILNLMGMAGRSRVIEQYTWDAVVTRLVKEV